MSEENTQAGGAGTENGGAGSEGQPDSGKTEAKGKVVSWEQHQRALSDMHKFKSELTDVRKKLGDAESKRLQEKEDYKSLWEQQKSETETYKTKYEDTIKTVVKTSQFAEVKAEALKSGLLESALPDLDLLDLSDVQVEATSNGRFLVTGAKEKVAALKEQRSHWFKKVGAPAVNGGGGGTPPPAGKVSENDVIAAEMDYKRGRITKDSYQTLYKKYLRDNPNG